jgi:hypothetical protein
LYIITIQPLLYALKAQNVGIEVQWEGRSAKLFSMAHADDLILFLANKIQHEDAQAILDLYCTISHAVMHPGKATALFPGEISFEGKTGWHQEIKTKSSVDFTHMGCPMRVDGESPETELQGLLVKVGQSCITWELSNRPLPARVEIMNVYILSKIWHATQLCPIYPEFIPALRTIIKSFIFPHRQRLLIDFEYICYPRRLGGLGLLNPEKMIEGMNGRAIARMIADEGNLGNVFKLQLLHTIETEGGCFFRLLGHAKWADPGLRMPNKGPPFWQRIYDTLLNFNLSVSTDWDKYMDEEILSLPYDLPVITGVHTKLLATQVRSSLFPLRIFLLRDILILDRGQRL